MHGGRICASHVFTDLKMNISMQHNVNRFVALRILYRRTKTITFDYAIFCFCCNIMTCDQMKGNG